MIIRHAHQSGRFDATPDQQAAMLARFTAACSVGVVTEAEHVDRPPTGWAMAGNETVILWEVDEWAPLGGTSNERHGIVSIPTGPWKRGNSPRTSVEIAWTRLLDRTTGLRLLRFGGHLPAHLFRPTQRKANAAALAGLADALAPVIAATKPDEVTGSFDFNRPLTSTRHAKLITDAVAPLGLRLVVPPKATLRLRTIDGFVTNARCVPVDGATGMLPRQPGYDHRGCRMHTCACVTAVQA